MPRHAISQPVAISQPFTCASCEARIQGSAVFYAGIPFCCAGCVAGGPCMCSYDVEVTDDDRRRAPEAAEEVAAQAGSWKVTLLAVH
jgi:hypothetical protein